jgi:hypothetical protein
MEWSGAVPGFSQGGPVISVAVPIVKLFL